MTYSIEKITEGPTLVRAYLVAAAVQLAAHLIDDEGEGVRVIPVLGEHSLLHEVPIAGVLRSARRQLALVQVDLFLVILGQTADDAAVVALLFGGHRLTISESSHARTFSGEPWHAEGMSL